MSEREEIIEQLAEWIVTHVIAEVIVDKMEDNDVAVTLQAAQSLWLDALEHLYEIIYIKI